MAHFPGKNLGGSLSKMLQKLEELMEFFLCFFMEDAIFWGKNLKG